jgi:quaternary ammonium compound-resistance protein SugE
VEENTMSSGWILLIVAGLLEIVWAVGLKYTQGFSRPLPSAITLTAMVLSIILLSRALRTIPVGTGYAVWTGIGAVGTAVVGILILGEPRSAGRVLAITTIIGGIVGLKLASPQ